ncbi:hypothetical protein J2TS6_42600 [Paenibacillus albilobatus]|uniref:Uncharacterized protein n=1 Tax=Paenibacillus albilobatus TaxID=2716884 RepID=A0A919XJX2_9BACL|nr:hypothetical protein [Paenibacillus albilobatus]GIO33119.1 hypothetical protein J2TS6_42600 [Paenibacillus albilobatus]
MKLREPLNFAGRFYEAGESVKGQLPLDMIKALRENHKLDEEEAETPEVNLEENKLDQLPIASDTIPSPEEFADLPAAGQKERLKALEIDPASKEEDRIEQYEDWYFEQVGNANQGDL